MSQADKRPTRVHLRDLDPDLRERAEDEVRKQGFKSLNGWMRAKIHELAGEA